MKNLFYILSLLAVSLLVGCGTVKSVVKSDTAVSLVKTSDADSVSTKITDTKTYGDTLKGNTFIPIDTAKADSADTDTVTVVSDGIALQFVAKTKLNKHGQITGEFLSYTGIAKPVTTTDTHEATHTNVKTTTVKDSTAKVESTTKKTIGFVLPSWVWWVIGFAIFFVTSFLIVKHFL